MNLKEINDYIKNNPNEPSDFKHRETIFKCSFQGCKNKVEGKLEYSYDLIDLVAKNGLGNNDLNGYLNKENLRFDLNWELTNTIYYFCQEHYNILRWNMNDVYWMIMEEIEKVKNNE